MPFDEKGVGPTATDHSDSSVDAALRAVLLEPDISPLKTFPNVFCLSEM